jgi:hypothetical protein
MVTGVRLDGWIGLVDIRLLPDAIEGAARGCDGVGDTSSAVGAEDGVKDVVRVGKSGGGIDEPDWLAPWLGPGVAEARALGFATGRKTVPPFSDYQSLAG